ncbi:hypothetical protein [Geothrix sp. 21YS21S-4]|uniref:hypothetical protein n=1 Tax=Geothrix sp. 21YS21S-4 TaxID=3068889 RepID=UPI0027BA7995|nr:hypothetical protein [Geothrix sp. 21YS21S-4]
MRLPLFMLLLALPLAANGLDDLRAALAKLPGGDPVKATLEHSFWRQIVDDKKPTITQGKVSAHVEDGPQGLRVTWARPALQQAAKELAVQEREPEHPTPTRTALKNLDPLETAEALNHAEALLRDLSLAQLQEERSEAWQGRPARLLVLKLDPILPPGQRKYLKELKVDAKLWVGPDGLPLAFTTAVALKGSRMFITFEAGNTQERLFARVGGRLVVTRNTTEDRTAGLGASNQTKKITTLTVL